MSIHNSKRIRWMREVIVESLGVKETEVEEAL